jgi:putative transposase
MTIRPELLDELLKDYAKPEDLVGEAGLLKQLTIIPGRTVLRH